jgi:UDP-2,3-diacylglucosamine pyrophosphatase LpxH
MCCPTGRVRLSVTTGQAAEAAKYRKDVAKALTRIFESDATEVRELDLDAAKIVILSDHHKGARDGADDFLRCERAYAAALAYYLEEKFTLFVLGDVEELWECSPKEVVKEYKDTLELEAQFHRAGRYERFWGNHDDQWREAKEVTKYLTTENLFPGLRVREALKLNVVRGGERVGLLFFVHGHQGTLDSDRFARFSRLFVRHVWRPAQRRLKMASTTPSRDFQLRARHDEAMFHWARDHPEKPVIIAGHTHRPVFWDSRPPRVAESVKDLEAELEKKRAAKADEDELAKLHARLQFVRASQREKGPPPIEIKPPCYFNTGCCSFGDGDVTGIEIVDGLIRLVRWPDDEGEPVSKLLVEENLTKVLDHVATGSQAAR